MPTPSVATGSNTFIPSVEATGRLVTDYSRNVNDFGLPRYVQYTPITKQRGRYIRMSVEQAGRFANDGDPASHLWGPGTDPPIGNENRESFAFYEVEAKRYLFPSNLDYDSVSDADFNIMEHVSPMLGQQAMTARTLEVYNRLTTPGNWPTGHYYVTPEALLGGAPDSQKHDLSTTQRRSISKTFHAMYDQIRRATWGSVRKNQIQVVVSPEWAKRVVDSQELVDFIKGSPEARNNIDNGLSTNAAFGLPDRLYGYNLVVEDAVWNPNRKGSVTQTKLNVWGDGDIVMVSRPGQLQGIEGAPSFSTIQFFLREDMSFQAKDNPDARRHELRVVDHYISEITSPISGVYVADVLSS